LSTKINENIVTQFKLVTMVNFAIALEQRKNETEIAADRMPIKNLVQE
jgi:hypothetical protein